MYLLLLLFLYIFIHFVNFIMILSLKNKDFFILHFNPLNNFGSVRIGDRFSESLDQLIDCL